MKGDQLIFSHGVSWIEAAPVDVSAERIEHTRHLEGDDRCSPVEAEVQSKLREFVKHNNATWGHTCKIEDWRVEMWRRPWSTHYALAVTFLDFRRDYLLSRPLAGFVDAFHHSVRTGLTPAASPISFSLADLPTANYGSVERYAWQEAERRLFYPGAEITQEDVFHSERRPGKCHIARAIRGNLWDVFAGVRLDVITSETGIRLETETMSREYPVTEELGAQIHGWYHGKPADLGKVCLRHTAVGKTFEIEIDE